MKKSLLILILIFNLQSLANADDAKNFEIEGMSIGDSALKYLSKNEIKNKLLDPKSFRYKNETFISIGTYSNEYKIYDYVGMILKPNDKNYKIYSLEGTFNYGNKIDECYQKQRKISKDIDDLIGKNTVKDSWNGKYRADKSGKSLVRYIDYSFKNSSAIRIICFDMSEDFTDTNDQLMVVVNSAEFMKFLEEN